MLGINFKRASHASVLLVCFMILKSLLGLYLKRTIAGYFGAGMETDAYFAAFTVPQQLGDFVVGGIVLRIIIPVFQQRKCDVGDQKAMLDLSGIMNYSILVLLVLSVLYYLFIPQIVCYIFSGFNRETLDLTISLSKLLSPAILLMGLSLIYTAFYHVHKNFLIPALTTVIFPVTSLLSIWFLPSEWGIYRLVYGNLAGVFFALFVLMILIGKNFSWSWNFNIMNPALKTTLLMAYPLLIANMIGRLTPFVQKNIASGLPHQGNVSLLEYAVFLSNAVLLFVASPITTAIFPLMGEHKSKGEDELLINTYQRAVKTVIFIALPCTVLLALESKSILFLILKTGKFSDNDAVICAKLIFILSFMIIPQCINLLSSNLIFVDKRTGLYAICLSSITLLSIPLYYFMAGKFAIFGIAMTYSFVYSVICLAFIAIIFYRYRALIVSGVIITSLKFIISGVLMVSTVLMVRRGLELLNINFIVSLIITTVLGGVVYLVLTYLMKISELRFILSRILPIKPEKIN